MAIAERMGVTLQNVSYSVNIKERLDFSCALFDPEGALIANAPHVPVHLGSMSEAVKSIISSRSVHAMKPGDVYMMNAPYKGGTHIPDGSLLALKKKKSCAFPPIRFKNLVCKRRMSF